MLHRKKNNIQTRKVLHKVKKRWVVISLMLLVTCGGVALSNATASADPHPQAVSSGLNSHPESAQGDHGEQSAGPLTSAFGDFNVKQALDHVNRDDWYRTHSAALHRLVKTDLAPQTINQIVNGNGSAKAVNLFNDASNVDQKLSPRLLNEKQALQSPFSKAKYGDLGPAFKDLNLDKLSQTSKYRNLLRDANVIISNRKDPKQISALRDMSNNFDEDLVSGILRRARRANPSIKNSVLIENLLGKDLTDRLADENDAQISDNADQIVKNFRDQVKSLVSPNDPKPQSLIGNPKGEVFSQLVGRVSDVAGGETSRGHQSDTVSQLISTLEHLPGSRSAFRNRLNDFVAAAGKFPGTSASSIANLWESAGAKDSWAALVNGLPTATSKGTDAHNFAVLMKAVSDNHPSGIKDHYQNFWGDLNRVYSDVNVKSSDSNRDVQTFNNDAKALASDLNNLSPRIDLTDLKRASVTLRNRLKPLVTTVNYVDHGSRVGSQTFMAQPGTIEKLSLPRNYRTNGNGSLTVGKSDRTVNVDVTKVNIPRRPNDHVSRQPQPDQNVKPKVNNQKPAPNFKPTTRLPSSASRPSSQSTRSPVSKKASDSINSGAGSWASSSRPGSNRIGRSSVRSIYLGSLPQLAPKLVQTSKSGSQTSLNSSHKIPGPESLTPSRSLAASFSSRPSSDSNNLNLAVDSIPQGLLAGGQSPRLPQLRPSDYVTFDKAIRLKFSHRGRQQSIRLLPNTYMYVVKHLKGHRHNDYLVNANGRVGRLTVEPSLARHAINLRKHRLAKLKIIKELKMHSSPNFKSSNVVLEVGKHRRIKVSGLAHDTRGNVRLKVNTHGKTGYVTASNAYVQGVDHHQTRQRRDLKAIYNFIRRKGYTVSSKPSSRLGHRAFEFMINKV